MIFLALRFNAVTLVFEPQNQCAVFFRHYVKLKAANIRSPPVFTPRSPPILLSVTPLVFFTTHGVEGKYFSIYGKRRLYIAIPLN